MDKWVYAHLNIGLPEDLNDRIRKHPEIRWATVARELIIRYLDELEKFKSEQSIMMPKPEKVQ
jgi:hypothetical protein